MITSKNLNHYAPVVDLLGELINLAFEKCFSDYKCDSASIHNSATDEGFNNSDIGHALRHYILKECDGIVFNNGYIRSVKKGTKAPINTTWLRIADIGCVFVNCVTPLSANRYQLNNAPCNIPDSNKQLSLFPYEPILEDYMIGIIWNFVPQNRCSLSMHAKAILLGGFLDNKSRIFKAFDERVLHEGWYGRKGDNPPISPAGPTPQIIRP